MVTTKDERTLRELVRGPLTRSEIAARPIDDSRRGA